jgi:aspartyl-tRNA(Asn)/glutamyl-tRNA(Gln) amidotransferase subunit A
MKVPHEMGVAELGRALAQRQLSSVEATKHLLARVAAHEQLGALLCTDEALARRASAAARPVVRPGPAW